MHSRRGEAIHAARKLQAEEPNPKDRGDPAWEGAVDREVLDMEKSADRESVAGLRGPGEEVAPHVLTWTDPETGERLTVNLEGSERFLRQLEPHGFEPLGTGPAESSAQRLGGERKEARRAWISIKANLTPEE